MDKNSLEMLAELRKHCVERFVKLDRVNPSAVEKESKFALELETIIRSLDDILKPYAKFV